MRAAVLHAFGEKLRVEEVADPQVRAGGVVVDVVATPVLPYTAEVFAGERNYQLTLPVVPGIGAVGRVAATGPDATRLKQGDWVLCDPTLRSRDGGLTPDIMLQGWSAAGDGGLLVQQWAGQGSFAEKVLVPTENVFPLGAVDEADAGRWCAAGQLLVPYGGFRAGGLRPGQSVLVSGATGNFGSTAVSLALALGAARVVASGRDESILAGLAERFGPRLRPARLSGDEERDRATILEAGEGPVDLVLDMLPAAAGTGAVKVAAMCVRENGVVVLMGGQREDLALPYGWLMRGNVTLRGQWMYPPAANLEMIKLIRSGVVDLGLFDVTAFALNDANAAVDHAAAHPRGFQVTVLQP